ncbi:MULTISPECIES: hypothetical protein [unclassified Moraxella]|uniref:hypothetical protein n=1 Tax=unclassified Moraxella TaxID=2685852 RepID=UPI003AF836B9
MKNKLFFAVYTLAVFFLGVFTTFAITYQSNHTDSQNSLSKENQHPISANALAQPNFPQIIASTIASSPMATLTNNAKQANQNTFNTQQFNEQQAKQLVNALPNAQLNQYVERFMTTKDAELINDKRQFANRAIEELYKANDNQPLIGQVLIGDSTNLPSQSLNTAVLQKKQKLFAHLNTFGKVKLGANVFVKWTNRTTGEVLLFEKKLIVPNSNENWVSYQPYEGWQVGSYDVKFYQFTSQLEPVAQLSYDVNQVVD